MKAPTLNPVETEDLIYTLSIIRYVKSLGYIPYDWQEDILNSFSKRKAINGARQGGKSTVICSKPCHRARFFPESLSIIISATERQAVIDMNKVKDFIARDPNYPKIVRDSDEYIKLANKSEIVIVPATEKSARGDSSPDLIIIDEAAWVEDAVYKSGIRAMLTDNEKCELILVSTPHGREGFFFKAFDPFNERKRTRWERFEIRAPWEVNEEEWTLYPAEPEELYKAKRAKLGIRAYYSYRHRILEEQQDNLEEIGPLMYKQEVLCQFIEPEEQVFDYEDIARMFEHDREVKPLDVPKLGDSDLSPIEV